MQRGWSVSPSFAGRALQVGFVTGLRSQVSLPLLAGMVQRPPGTEPLPGPFDWLRSPRLLALTRLSAAGEIVVDKLPIVPSRLDPGPLLGRFVFAGVASTGLALVARQAPLPAAILGIIGGAVGSVAGNRARAYLVSSTALPDLAGAVVEDLLAIGLGMNAVSGVKPAIS